MQTKQKQKQTKLKYKVKYFMQFKFFFTSESSLSSAFVSIKEPSNARCLSVPWVKLSKRLWTLSIAFTWKINVSKTRLTAGIIAVNCCSLDALAWPQMLWRIRVPLWISRIVLTIVSWCALKCFWNIGKRFTIVSKKLLPERAVAERTLIIY